MQSPERFFDPEPKQKAIALDLYAGIKGLPIISPHGHVDPSLFSDPERRFGNPAELLIKPDHYINRMLVSQGVAYDQILSNEDPRSIWRLYASHAYLFRGTPSGAWLDYELETVFGVTEKPNAENADRIYDQIEAALASPAAAPRTLFERFNIEVLATTDSAADTLDHHRAIRSSGWSGRIIPTFRPDSLINITAPNWREGLNTLSAVSRIDIHNYSTFICALEQRRADFKALGATATDSGVISPTTEPLTTAEAGNIFSRALKSEADQADATRFTANMLFEMARMSAEDGLVMQIHAGALRNHNASIFERFGADRGFDIPVSVEFTRSLQPLLNHFGNHPNFHLILFTLDETTYARELAPLAGAYPAVKLGPPWWFNDSWNGMRRFFDQVIETAGLYNTAGFNDDTRAFPSIPARHDLWRRASADWLAGLVARHVIDASDAQEMAQELAYGLAKRAYRL